MKTEVVLKFRKKLSWIRRNFLTKEVFAQLIEFNVQIVIENRKLTRQAYPPTAKAVTNNTC